MIRKMFIQWAAVTMILLAADSTQSALAAKCLFVSSYHQGYDWSDGIERGLRTGLGAHCEIRQFNMNTKRHKSEKYKQKMGVEAKALIETWQPDIVITADDNAAKYLIQPFFKDAALPIVFCGVNWTADEYGFPYSNVTGMIEIAPIFPMLEKAIAISGNGKTAVYIGAKTLTEEKNRQRIGTAAGKLNIEMHSELVSDTNGWLAAYREAQAHDFIILGSNAGIADWDSGRVKREILLSSSRLSVTNHGWMMPFSMLGLTKVPEEQGRWAAEAAVAILNGMRPSEIAIIANLTWDVWSNERLLDAAGITLPWALKSKAKEVRPK